ncbi:MAG: hypothetical protein K8R74_17440 [Bacteroidales bacterium]|nr:hypothetical protein [Bacteroidales bacterium]
MKMFSVLFSLLLITTTWAYGQHESETHDESHFQHHRLALFTGYGLIPGAINDEGNKQVKVIPVLGIDYEYWFNHKFALGLQNDLELASYSVENEKEKYLEREYAFVTALVFLYEPLRGLAFFAGPGYEFEHNQNFAVFKVGTEVLKIFEGGWSTGIIIAYDIKEVNSSFSLGVTVGKKLGK